MRMDEKYQFLFSFEVEIFSLDSLCLQKRILAQIFSIVFIDTIIVSAWHDSPACQINISSMSARNS